MKVIGVLKKHHKEETAVEQQVDEREAEQRQKAVVQAIAREVDRLTGLSQLVNRVEKLEEEIGLLKGLVNDIVSKTIAETVKSVVYSEVLVVLNEIKTLTNDLKFVINDLRNVKPVIASEVQSVVSESVESSVRKEINDVKQELVKPVKDLSDVIEEMKSVIRDLNASNRNLSGNINNLVEVVNLAGGFRNALESINKYERDLDGLLSRIKTSVETLERNIEGFNEAVEQLREYASILTGETTRSVRGSGNEQEE